MHLSLSPLLRPLQLASKPAPVDVVPKPVSYSSFAATRECLVRVTARNIGFGNYLPAVAILGGFVRISPLFPPTRVASLPRPLCCSLPNQRVFHYAHLTTFLVSRPCFPLP